MLGVGKSRLTPCGYRRMYLKSKCSVTDCVSLCVITILFFTFKLRDTVILTSKKTWLCLLHKKGTALLNCYSFTLCFVVL